MHIIKKCKSFKKSKSIHLNKNVFSLFNFVGVKAVLLKFVVNINLYNKKFKITVIKFGTV